MLRIHIDAGTGGVLLVIAALGFNSLGVDWWLVVAAMAWGAILTAVGYNGGQ